MSLRSVLDDLRGEYDFCCAIEQGSQDTLVEKFIRLYSEAAHYEAKHALGTLSPGDYIRGRNPDTQTDEADIPARGACVSGGLGEDAGNVEGRNGWRDKIIDSSSSDFDWDALMLGDKND